MESRTIAIVIAFHPDRNDLERVTRAYLEQGCDVLLVDNSASESSVAESLIRDLREHSIFRISNSTNRGVAAALNVGIQHAVAYGYDFVVLSDQDSEPLPNMVTNLKTVLFDAENDLGKVALVSPTFIDVNSGVQSKLQVQGRFGSWYSKADASTAEPYREVMTAITSGSLIPTRVFEQIGLMEEGLFIDGVDWEWCLRARYLGYAVISTSTARMRQTMGVEALRMWLFGWRSFSDYAPVRIYYQVRNFFLLARRDSVPLGWLMRIFIFNVQCLYAHLIFTPSRLEKARYIAIGVWDGLRGKEGKYVSRTG